MKRYFCFFLAVLITAMSIILYCPFSIYANDAFTISKNSTEKTGLTADEAQKAIDANADIKGKDGVTMLLYTPSDSYNYTLKSGAFVAHLSDSQAKAMLMSKKSFQQYVVLCSSLISNGTVFRGFLKTVGIATAGDSDVLTNIVDKFTCNYNYLDSINYDEDTQTITMDNTSVDKLREEIKEYYYESLGVCLIKSSGKPSDGVYQIRSAYDDIDEYNHDLTAANDFDYAFFTSTTDVSDAYTLAMFNKKDISYLYAQIDTSSYFSHCYSLMFSDDGVSSFYLFSKMKYFYNYYNTADLGDYYSNYYYTQDSFVGYGIDMCNLPYISSIYPCYIKGKDYGNNPTATRIYKLYRHSDYFSSAFYSKDGSPLVVFKSQSALYNYIQGDQSAYLSKTINNTGEDIIFSIKDMNENLGEKMDTLIDTINDKKGSMSADELQNAIDKGLEDISKNTEDIKDNTSDILDVLREQNQILLDILGVTTNIYKVVKDSDSKDKTYNVNYVQSVFNSMFKGLKNAILYGENTVRDDVSEDTDDIDSIVSDIPPDKKNYHNGLFGRFPFSVPYQLFDWLQALYVEPVAPKFTLSYAYLFKDLGYETNNFEFVIDLGDEKYSKWIELVRSGEKLSFIIYMAIATYHRFKNEI